MKFISNEYNTGMTIRFRVGMFICVCMHVVNVHAQHSSTVTADVKRPSEEVSERLQSTLLADAILQLAETRQLEVAYAPELLVGKSVDCPTLPEEDEAAIRCLLEKSGLGVTKLSNGVYVIQKSPVTKQKRQGAMSGQVRNYDTGKTLAGAHIIVLGTQYATTSSKRGTFEFDQISPGLYDVQVSIVGYAPKQFAQIHVIAGQLIEVDFELTESTMLLDEVLVTSKYKRKWINLPDTLQPIGYQGFRLGGLSAGLLMSSAPAKVNGVQIAGLGSRASDSLKGVQFAGVFNSAKTADGAQFGGISNSVDGDLNGYQFSGMLNMLGGELQGGQFGGIFNLVDHDADGIQASGIANISEDLRGAQFAGIINQSEDMRGFQGAGISNYSRQMKGMQASGIANIAQGDFQGVQAAGMVNIGGSTKRGVQLSGLVNVANYMEKGVQIGLINIANDNKGLPLGLFSYVRETGLRFDVWVDERGMTSTGIRSGNRWFSNYIGVAAQPDESFDHQAILLGLGGEINFGPKLYGSLDAFYHMFGWESFDFDEHLIKTRLLVGFKVTPRVALFGGPSLNLFLSNTPETTIPLPGHLIEEGTWKSTDYKVWSGFALGLRIFGKP